jgi:hypothetical protein
MRADQRKMEREREVQNGPALKNKKLDKDGRHGTSACCMLTIVLVRAQ